MINLTYEKIVALAVMLFHLLLRQQMQAFTNELCEFLIHFPLSLRLNISKSLRNNCDKQVEHNNDQEQGCNHKNQIYERRPNLTELISAEVTKHELERHLQ